jgi:hypothetical protein
VVGESDKILESQYEAPRSSLIHAKSKSELPPPSGFNDMDKNKKSTELSSFSKDSANQSPENKV